MLKQLIILIALLPLGFSALRADAADVGATFVYEGRLWRDGEPLTTFADLQFRLFDSPEDGSRIGPMDTRLNAAVMDGRFTAKLNFGENAFDGQARWLEIRLREPAGEGAWITLEPRQRIHAVPYALYAVRSGDGGVGGPQGPQGPQGPTGPDGAQGPAGPQGDTGPQGPAGADGAQGPQGDAGPQGAQGPQGDTGQQGLQGPQGDTGPQGPQGDAGPQGPQGDDGPQGPQGVQGPAGDPAPAMAPAIFINLINHSTTLELTTSTAALWKIPANGSYGRVSALMDMTRLGAPTGATLVVVYTNTASSGTNQIGVTLNGTPQPAGTTVTPLPSSVVALANTSTYPQTIEQELDLRDLGTTKQWLQLTLNLEVQNVGPNVMSATLILYY